MARGQSPYQGGYTFPVASTVERSMQQAASAQAQMYAGLGRTFGDAIGKYFEGQDEKKAVESMAENPIALDVVFQGRDVPADRNERIKAMRGVVKASGGFKNFLGRIETERANQRADRAETLAAENQRRLMESHALNRQLGEQRLELGGLGLEDARSQRRFEEMLFEEQPGKLPEAARMEAAGLQRFDPRSPKFAQASDLQPGQKIDPSGFMDVARRRGELEKQRLPGQFPAEMSSAELSRWVSESDLPPGVKRAARGEIDKLRAQETAALKFRAELATASATLKRGIADDKRKDMDELRKALARGDLEEVYSFDNLSLGRDFQLAGRLPNETEAIEIKGQLGTLNGALRMIDELIVYGEEYDAELWRTAEEAHPASALALAIQGQLREDILGPGAVTDSERVILEKIVPNPDKLFTWMEGKDGIEELRRLKVQLKNNFKARLAPHRITAAPLTGRKKTGTTPARGSTVMPAGITLISETEIGAAPATPAPTPAQPATPLGDVGIRTIQLARGRGLTDYQIYVSFQEKFPNHDPRQVWEYLIQFPADDSLTGKPQGE